MPPSQNQSVRARLFITWVASEDVDDAPHDSIDWPTCAAETPRRNDLVIAALSGGGTSSASAGVVTAVLPAEQGFTRLSLRPAGVDALASEILDAAARVGDLPGTTGLTGWTADPEEVDRVLRVLRAFEYSQTST